MPEVVLRSGHVQPVWAGHPWVFAQAIERIVGDPKPGDEVDVIDARQNFLGRGLFSPKSAIRVRLFSRDDERFDRDLLVQRVRAAEDKRVLLGIRSDEPGRVTDSYRSLYGEGDDLPGLIVDRLGSVLSVQFTTVGMALRRELVLDALEEVYAPSAIVDRTAVKAAQAEGFQAQGGVARGQLSGFEVRERGLYFALPLELGQKTGFYFDQRPLRDVVERLSRGREVLDAYSFVGAGGLSAARGGASRVLSVDSSEVAVRVGREAARANELNVEFLEEDAEQVLEQSSDRFDLVLVDPPKFAHGRAQKEKAARAFRRLIGLAVRATRRGGLLCVSSCSQAIDASDLTRALALGARDQGRRAQVIERVFQGADHPVPAAFPEGLYLSSIIAVLS